MPWLVKFEGEVLNTERLTLDELESIERISGVPWILLNPVQSMTVAKALLALCLVRKGEDDEKARDRIGTVTVAEIRDSFELVEEGADLPEAWSDGQPDPKAAAEVPTSGSSGLSGTSDGPLT